MATTTSGKVIVPLDKALTDKEIVKLIKRSGAQAVIFDEKYQNAIEVFPASIIAKLLNFKKEEYYEIKSEEKENIEVNLNKESKWKKFIIS